MDGSPDESYNTSSTKSSGRRSEGTYFSNNSNNTKAALLPANAHVNDNKKNLRKVYINSSPIADDSQTLPSNTFTDNSIHTAKYNILTFLPKNLFEQFRRLANFYFLALVVLQSFPEFSTSTPILVVLPIASIITVTAIKDAFEDWKRHRSDEEINHSICLVASNIINMNSTSRKSIIDLVNSLLSNFFRYIAKARHRKNSISTNAQYIQNLQDGWSPTYWQDLRVGDIILISNNQPIPADILVLSTSEADNICYVETKNLDGETNLKIRSGPSETAWIKNTKNLNEFSCYVETEDPNNNLYSFFGSIVISNEGADLKFPSNNIPVSINNLLLRGCILRNTKWVIGVAVFCGNQTKLIMNSGNTPSKRSAIERQMNIQVILNFAILLSLCVFIAFGAVSFYSATKGNLASYMRETYISDENDPSAFSVWIHSFAASLILLQNIVPISLYVTTELVKTIQAYFIYCDKEMYHEPYDTPCMTRNWAIADDLGQIEYLFSDKTGTLTQNIMRFRKCSILGISYGGYHTQKDTTTRQTEFSEMSFEDRMKACLVEYYANPYLSDDIEFVDRKFVRHLYSNRTYAENIKIFFTHLAICHTVLAEYPDPDDDKRLIYQAQSPDEAALVSTARDMGFVFLDRDRNSISISVLGILKNYEILQIIEFTSARKRMSVIAKSEDGIIYLFCKGADSVIFERLASEQVDLKETTLIHLENFANEGLRTLCIAYKIISPDSYDSWAEEYGKASCVVDGREAFMECVASKMEKDLVLLGATAIEDQLQDGVPDCISRILTGGIKIWVLTGDKMETAINIGFSCSLFSKDMILVVIKGNSTESTKNQMIEALKKCFGIDSPVNGPSDTSLDFLDHSGKITLADEKVEMNQIGNNDTLRRLKRPFALVIDGDSLKYALNSENSNQQLFLDLATRCKAVMCCRVSPLQKAKVVETVKKSKKVMTLAIGDGANDVSMIQAAHVGVGILGLEGRQAVMASDYAIGQFRFLNRLLLVHGRWSYRRIALMTLFMFYKNIVWAMVLFWYQIYSGWSSRIPYDYIHIQFYNLIYTGATPVIVGVFDQDVTADSALAIPQIYVQGIRHELYGIGLFILCIFDGLYQSVCCFYISYLVFHEATFSSHGHDSSSVDFGTLAATMAVINANLYMGLQTMHWTWMNHLFLWGSPVIFLLGTIGASLIESYALFGVSKNLIFTPFFWLCVLLSIITCQLPRFVLMFYKQAFTPNDVDIIREIEKFKLKNQFKAALPVLSSNEDKGEPEFSEETASPQLTKKDISSSENDGDRKKMETIWEVSRRSSASLDRLANRFTENIKKASSLLFFVKTRTSIPVTGYAFSQEPGMASHIEYLETAEERKNNAKRKHKSMTGIDEFKLRNHSSGKKLFNRWSIAGDMLTRTKTTSNKKSVSFDDFTNNTKSDTEGETERENDAEKNSETQERKDDDNCK